MVTNRIIFFATSVQPNPEEIDYWVDLSDNPYGGSIKYFNGTEWVRLALVVYLILATTILKHR
jgi:hypothetical protein